MSRPCWPGQQPDGSGALSPAIHPPAARRRPTTTERSATDSVASDGIPRDPSRRPGRPGRRTGPKSSTGPGICRGTPTGTPRQGRPPGLRPGRAATQPRQVPARDTQQGPPADRRPTGKEAHMPTEAKQATVAELVAAFAASRSAIVADHRGLTVADLGRIRGELRGKGISYTRRQEPTGQDRRGAGGQAGVHAAAHRPQRGRPGRQPTRRRSRRASSTRFGRSATWSSGVAPSAARPSTRTR